MTNWLKRHFRHLEELHNNRNRDITICEFWPEKTVTKLTTIQVTVLFLMKNQFYIYRNNLDSKNVSSMLKKYFNVEML